ncbi:hypothetical protein C500_10324 [Natrialba magadii ATCC 43099]|uniref:YdbS-like PH domain-containing protein n=1 Tax=Natrialba magadii (strain ATCC 43099 / DSM 3394 / CCM 3739 / CIP 104546 / IAM 13178 / JCM 8861 / NBRC 102185 / NCIMB 2190 / MS3) TaxID=547559 RepID=L9UYT5_NATMM|nr:hypothetical protein C500_10324 [Natrialba magadii ATCC 43099]
MEYEETKRDEHKEGETVQSRTDSGSGSSSKDESYLLDDETVLVDTRPTWWGWTGYLALAGMFVGLGLLLSLVEVAVGLLTLVPGVLLVGYVWYQRTYQRYLVTDRRIIVSTGMTTRTTNETWVEDVSGLQTKTTSFSRSRGYGTITVSHTVTPSGFSLGGDLQLQGVPNYADVAQTIRRRQSERKGR